MSQWYYSDSQRNRHGPVESADLAMLHANGQLPPETLVWREGMSNWAPWRTVMHEVLPAAAPAAAPTADPFADPFAAPVAAAAPASDPFALEPTDTAPAAASRPAPTTAATTTATDGAYHPYAVAEPIAQASPYAPTRAALKDADTGYVAGGHVVYAGLWKRFAANIIDSFLMWIVTYPIQLMLQKAYMPDIIANPFGTTYWTFLGVSMLMSLAIGTAYFGFMQASGTQASLGKMAVGIKVTDIDGRRMAHGRSMLRYLCFSLLGMVTFGLTILVSGIMAAVTERKQALHDMICGTLVVDKHAFTENPDWQREELGVVTIIVLVLFGLFILGGIALIGVGLMALGGAMR